jgi:hypothetical protein
VFIKLSKVLIALFSCWKMMNSWSIDTFNWVIHRFQLPRYITWEDYLEYDKIEPLRDLEYTHNIESWLKSLSQAGYGSGIKELKLKSLQEHTHKCQSIHCIWSKVFFKIIHQKMEHRNLIHFAWNTWWYSCSTKFCKDQTIFYMLENSTKKTYMSII